MYPHWSRRAGRVFLCPLLLLWCAFDGSAQPRETKGVFPLERDHVFIWVPQGSPAVGLLQKSGLHTDGEVHKHVGQGTSSVVFMFENAYLELIWVDEPEVARRRSQAMGTDLLARVDWRRTGASPFGVGLRRRSGAGGDIPFPTKKYWAEWMKPDTFIAVAESSANLKEPFYFVVPDYMAVPPAEQLKQLFDAQPEYRKKFTHALGVRRLTGVRVVAERAGALSGTASTLSTNGVVVIERGKSPHAELTFDGGAQRKTLDLRPALPLILKY